MRIIVATHNEGKLAEINRILEDCLGADAARVELVSAGSLNLPDPVEDGVTFQENALLKARDVAACTGCPAIADDSGLIVDVMGNAPGILSARWSGKHGDDKANNALLLAQIADIPDAKRTARFRCAAALVVPETEAAVMAAHQLTHPGMLDLIPKYGGIAIQELRVNEWDGKTLVELNLMQQFNVMVMGIRPAGKNEFMFVPPAMTVLNRGDSLVVAGRADSMSMLKP